MKKIILPVLIILQFIFLFSCSKKEEKKGINFGKAKVKIENDTYNFGTINKGEVVEAEFVIKNISDVPFIIRSAKATTCDCTTVSSWTKKEIYKGEEAKIKVIFDSNKSKGGDQKKSITLLTNSSNIYIILTLKGNVKVS
tara:strand:- start:377 stop:796 length:420 start_codon:yes stop_codon:yes gene_type:complete